MWFSDKSVDGSKSGEEKYKKNSGKKAKVLLVVGLLVTIAIIATVVFYFFASRNTRIQKDSVFATNINDTASDKVKEVSVGLARSAAVTEDGSLWIWGWDEYDQLGDGTTPVKILGDVREVSVDGYGAAITENGSLWIWGTNRLGQLVDGTTTDDPAPIKKILENVKKVYEGGSVVIMEDGSLWSPWDE